MEKITISYKKCLGCGIILQNTDASKIGYIVDLANDFCLRCFQTRNYNKLINYDVNEQDYIEMIKKNYHQDHHYVYILDIYDFFGSRNNNIEELIKHNKVTIIINKIDLINKMISLNKLTNFINDNLKINFNLTNYKLIFVSAIKNFGIDELYDEISKSFKKKIFFIGISSSGKSSIINALLKRDNNNLLVKPITISSHLGTTLDNIELIINKKIVVDTPGIKNDYHIYNNITHANNTSKLFYNIKKITPITYQLFHPQYIAYENITFFKFMGGEEISFHFYVNAQINLHRGKLENLTRFYETSLNNKTLNLLSNIPLISKSFLIKKGEHSLFISGLGWISFTNKKPIEIKLKVPENVKITLTKKLI